MNGETLTRLLVVGMAILVGSGRATDSVVKAPEIRLKSAIGEPAPGHRRMEFEIANSNSRQSLPYLGYLSNSFDPPLKPGQIVPWYLIRVRVDGKWIKRDPVFCKTGVGQVALAPRSRRQFTVFVEDDGKWDAVKIGFRWRPDFDPKTPRNWNIVWSRPITRKGLSATTQRKSRIPNEENSTHFLCTFGNRRVF